MADAWTWPGARWWKCDLHVHTPGSDDHKDDPAPAAAALAQAAKNAGLHAVAVTDHNTPAWVGSLHDSALTVFPGVELTCAPSVHLLVLFDPALAPDLARDAVAGFIGKCDVEQPAGGKNHTFRSKKSIHEVMKIANEKGAVCLAAHADDAAGFLKELRGEEIRLVIKSPYLHGVELKKFDPVHTPYLDGSMKDYRRDTGVLPLLTFSDAHTCAAIGTRYTWVKMTEPTLGGLRLALQDGPPSVRNDQAPGVDPNSVPDLAIESISIGDTVHLGNGKPFEMRLNPWLNALIGGRGTGKSTVVELLRVALQRGDEVPRALRDEWDNLIRLPDATDRRGVLKPKTEVSVVYRRDGGRFRIRWTGQGSPPGIEQDEGRNWVRREGDVASRFPVRIYSQKQVYELTREPEALLRIIDESHEVNAGGWAEDWKAEEARFLSLRAQAREVESALADEPRVIGALDDVKRRLIVFETAGHAGVLKTWQSRRRQERAVEEWEAGLGAAIGKMSLLAKEAEPSAIDSAPFDVGDEADAGLLAKAAETLAALQKLRDDARQLVQREEAVKLSWVAARAASAWSGRVRGAVEDYERLIAALKAAGGGDPSEYGRLVQQRGALEVRLASFAGQRQMHQSLLTQAASSLARLSKLRDDLTRRRTEFLAATLKDNDYVRIDVVPFGSAEAVTPELRKLLGREDGAFAKDIGAPQDLGTLVGDLVAGYPDSFEQADPATRNVLVRTFQTRLSSLKEKLRAISKTGEGAQDRRFGQHLKDRTPESLDRLECWFPPDSLVVSYKTVGGAKYQPITQGSPGQRSAAMLAFLLSYGSEPIVLDQPEDDLDNHLIYDLIVKQLRLIKLRRQVLVVTHNANIVVNGDAEYVLALKAGRGQAHPECDGGLQEQKVRDTICAVMEGGKVAFRDRYRRIALGDSDV